MPQYLCATIASERNIFAFFLSQFSQITFICRQYPETCDSEGLSIGETRLLAAVASRVHPFDRVYFSFMMACSLLSFTQPTNEAKIRY